MAARDPDQKDETGKPEADAPRGDLDSRLKAFRQSITPKPRPQPGSSHSSAVGLAFRLGLEFTGGVVVGTVIGVLLDRWLGTAPWLMILFVFLGAGAGFANMYRAAKGLDETVGLGRAIEKSKRREEGAPPDRDDA